MIFHSNRQFFERNLPHLLNDSWSLSAFQDPVARMLKLRHTVDSVECTEPDPSVHPGSHSDYT